MQIVFVNAIKSSQWMQRKWIQNIFENIIRTNHLKSKFDLYGVLRLETLLIGKIGKYTQPHSD
ncbi:MAG: hypothetical protein K8Q89_08285 [Nitrosarchaeum sp.]|nr:hypothetical protein [Nitrosarchaeum sp.]